MSYRTDPDLYFLQYIDSEDLDPLVKCLTRNKDGSTRFTEELTLKDIYKENYPNHHVYWQEIAAELQCFGANTFATFFRGGEGVLYREVLCDVCDKMHVSYNDKQKISFIENNLLLKIVNDSIEKMSKNEIIELINTLNINTTDFKPEAIMAAIQIGIANSGFLAYQLAVIVANSVAKTILGSGLTFATNAALTRALSVFAGPIGLALTAIWTAISIAGAAYRVTIPAVILVSFLRKRLEFDDKYKNSYTQYQKDFQIALLETRNLSIMLPII